MHRSLSRLALVALLLAVPSVAYAAPAPAPAASPDLRMIGSFMLPGGLEVLTSEDHSTNKVYVSVWLDAGAEHDFAGYPGLSATTAIAVMEGGKRPLRAQIEALGGALEADLGREGVYLLATLPAAQLEAGLSALGEAIARPAWSELDLGDVTAKVRQFRAQLAKDPEMAVSARTLEALYGFERGHYSLGTDASTGSFKRADLEAFHHRHYLPNRTKVVLVGDFATGKSVGQVVNGFAAHLKRTAPGDKAPSRPLAAAPTPWTLEPMVAVAAQGPALKETREYAAMEMLGHVLAGSDNARVAQALAPSGVKVELLPTWKFMESPSSLVLVARAPKASAPAIEKAARDTLATLRDNPVSLDEHARAQRAVADFHQQEYQDPKTRAIRLGLSSSIVGDPQWALTYPEVVRQVSRQDMMAAAQKYLTPDAVKVLVLAP